jgi:DNA-binding IclR family transcriptional regulator
MVKSLRVRNDRTVRQMGTCVQATASLPEKQRMPQNGGVAAVDRALSILDALTDERVTLAELARRTGLYKSTVLRLAKSLENFGFVLRVDDGSFQLGSKNLHLGSLYQRHFRTHEIVPPVLRAVVAELHEGASFYIRDGDRRVVLHRVDAQRAVRDSVHEGDRFLVTLGAAGHVLRAFTGESGERLDRVRETMYAASYGERDPETAAVAAPVFGPNNVLVGALNVSGPRYRIEKLGEERIVPVLFKYAKQLTQMFGGNPQHPKSGRWHRLSDKPAPAVARRAAAKAAQSPRKIKPRTVRSRRRKD